MERIDKETKLAIRELYEDGYEPKEIVEMFGVSKTSIWRYTSRERKRETDRKNYRKRVARENGFDTYEEYRTAKRKARKIKLEKLSKLVRACVEDAPIGTKTKIAKAINVSRQAITLVIQGKYIPRREKLEALCDELNAPDTFRKALGLNQ